MGSRRKEQEISAILSTINGTTPLSDIAARIGFDPSDNKQLHHALKYLRRHLGNEVVLVTGTGVNRSITLIHNEVSPKVPTRQAYDPLVNLGDDYMAVYGKVESIKPDSYMSLGNQCCRKNF